MTIFPKGFNLLSCNKNFKKGNTVLKIDLNKISKNYLFLSKLCKPGIAGAVVKADAYGCGMSEVGRTLLKSGCNFFCSKIRRGLRVTEIYSKVQNNCYI